MSLNIGIIGLPNVGKSTTFNALTDAYLAEVANYPFCTIKSNRAIVPVPDIRIDKLQSILSVPNAIHATVEFVDIAGLVKGASHGEGLGNLFLGNIRNTNALLHIVRCFDDPNVVHISENPNPKEDIEIVNIELILADIQQLDKKIEKLSHQIKGDKSLISIFDLSNALKKHLSSGNPLSTFPHDDSNLFESLNKEMQFLTAKPVIYLANVSEDNLVNDNDYVKEVKEIAQKQNATTLTICSKLEQELIGVSEEEKRELLDIVGIKKSGLAKVIQQSYETLGLISFFTRNENEVRAWEITRGTTAQKAAGRIHTDFERGFIRAEVISYSDFIKYRNISAIRAAGALSLEGKDYVVNDGDIIQFRFNV